MPKDGSDSFYSMSLCSLNFRCSSESSLSPPVSNNRKNRRRKRGGRVNDEGTRSANDALPKNEDAVLLRGQGRGGRRGKANNLSAASGSGVSRLSYRANRFKDHLGHSTLGGSGAIARTTSQLLLNMFDERDELSADFESFQIVGTMQELEKRYLRLTRVSFSCCFFSGNFSFRNVLVLFSTHGPLFFNSK